MCVCVCVSQVPAQVIAVCPDADVALIRVKRDTDVQPDTQAPRRAGLGASRRAARGGDRSRRTVSREERFWSGLVGTEWGPLPALQVRCARARSRVCVCVSVCLCVCASVLRMSAPHAPAHARRRQHKTVCICVRVCVSQEPVCVAGFPIGGESLAVTQGVMSRCEVVEYSHSNRHLLALQVSYVPYKAQTHADHMLASVLVCRCLGLVWVCVCVCRQVDAPLNNGVWGGPVYDRGGRVLGMAFQKFTTQTWMERCDTQTQTHARLRYPRSQGVSQP